MTKPLISVFWLILLASLVACADTKPAPSDDILAPLPTSATEAGTGAENNANLPTLLELLSEDPNLVFFTNGLNNVGLADDLQSGGPFTVFAPSNVAFSQGDLIVSQMDPVLLGSILDHHLVEGTFSEEELLAAGSVTTLAGEQLTITPGSSAVEVAYAPLAAEARPARNGTLYVIDSLLLPPETGPEKSMWGCCRQTAVSPPLFLFWKAPK